MTFKIVINVKKCWPSRNCLYAEHFSSTKLFIFPNCFEVTSFSSSVFIGTASLYYVWGNIGYSDSTCCMMMGRLFFLHVSNPTFLHLWNIRNLWNRKLIHQRGKHEYSRFQHMLQLGVLATQVLISLFSLSFHEWLFLDLSFTNPWASLSDSPVQLWSMDRRWWSPLEYHSIISHWNFTTILLPSFKLTLTVLSFNGV